MNHHGQGVKNIYLRAGEILFTGEPAVVTTVLGSCLAVTMYHRRSGFAGISHSLLPQCPRRQCGRLCKDMPKYVECSIRWMVSQFYESGANPKEIEVKIFGGSDMFGIRSRKEDETVGRMNITAAIETLNDLRLKIHSIDTGGAMGRKIIFIMHTGEVFLKRLPEHTIMTHIGAGTR